MKADNTVSPAEKNRILKLVRGEALSAPVQNGNGQEPRIYSREETAKMVGDKTTRYVDQLCRRGLLQKFVPRGNKRAIGVTGESLTTFITGQPSTIRV